MEEQKKLLTDNQIIFLREGIKTKYRQYHLNDPIRFPTFEYNTNRANYEPLRTSFEEEFWVLRGLDRLSPTIHIPSTNTLTMLFTDDSYVPSKKILNTCLSYARGLITTNRHEVPVLVQASTSTPGKHRIILARGVFVIIAACILLLLYRWFFMPRPNGLVLERPIAHSTVNQEVIVEGKVANTEIIWLVVHPNSVRSYYVQPAVKVQDNNWWIGVVFIGGVQEIDEGHRYQIRAFVNPSVALSSGQILHSWPEAELATDVIEIVRGKKSTKQE